MLPGFLFFSLCCIFSLTHLNRQTWLFKWMYCYLFIRSDHWPAIVLAALMSLAFILIDFYCALNDISNVYLPRWRDRTDLSDRVVVPGAQPKE